MAAYFLNVAVKPGIIILIYKVEIAAGMRYRRSLLLTVEVGMVWWESGLGFDWLFNNSKKKKPLLINPGCNIRKYWIILNLKPNEKCSCAGLKVAAFHTWKHTVCDTELPSAWEMTAHYMSLMFITSSQSLGGSWRVRLMPRLLHLLRAVGKVTRECEHVDPTCQDPEGV